MDKSVKIYVAGHRGLVGSAILKKLKEKGYTNIVTRTSQELDLRRQRDVEEFFSKRNAQIGCFCVLQRSVASLPITPTKRSLYTTIWPSL